MENSTITVSVRTLQEEIFSIQIDPCETVKNFKEKINRIKGPDYPAEDIKLLFGGKFLLDSQRLCDYRIRDKCFVILVLKKETKNESDEEESEEEIASSPASPTPERVRYESTVARTEAEVLRFLQYQALVFRITELGFTREQAISALNVGGDNPDRAVDYLVTECLPCRSGNFEAIDIDACAPAYMWETPPSSRRSSQPEISQVRINHIFANAIAECQLRTRLQDYAIQQEAALITRSYEQMEAAHREALGLNPQARLPDNVFSGERLFVFNPEDVWSSSWGFRTLRDCDHEAIERLRRLGRFSTRSAVEAYFLCNRNEKAAAEYLITVNFRR